MNKYLIFTIALTIAFAGLAQSIHEQQAHASSLAAHVHGLSELTIALEDPILEIQLTSPAMNLVGFEHKAGTKKDTATVKKTSSLLRQHDALFLLTGALCDHVKTSIDLAGLIAGDDHEHAYQKNSNQDEHDHEDHIHNDIHRDIVANYKYRCKNIASLSSITVTLFESFPGIHKIHAMWVNQTQQGAATLTPNNHIINFR